MTAVRPYVAPASGPRPFAVRQRSSGRDAPRWIGGLVLTSIVLARAPLLTGHATVVRLALLLLFGAGIAWLLPRRQARAAGGAGLLLTAYLLIVGVTMLRGVSVGMYASSKLAALDWLLIVAVALLGTLFVAGAPRGAAFEQRLALVALAPATYVATNVALWVTRHQLPFGLPEVQSQAEGGTCELLGLLGIHATRVTFPLAEGVNNFGALAAMGFAGAVMLALRSRVTSRRIAWVAAGVCLYGVLMTDSRGPFFLALAAIMLFGMLRRLRTAGGLAVLVPLSPVIALATLSFLSGAGLFTFVSRQQGDLATGNNRLYIWKSVFDFLKHPSAEQIFGFGALGHVQSGVSYDYAYLFGNVPGAWVYTTHNLALQTILDSGYVGLIVLASVVIAAVRTLERSLRSASDSTAVAALAGLLVIVLSGTTEALPTYLFPDTLAAFALTVGAAIAATAPEPDGHAETPV